MSKMFDKVVYSAMLLDDRSDNGTNANQEV